jgi:hypothetical protein
MYSPSASNPSMGNQETLDVMPGRRWSPVNAAPFLTAPK